MNACLTSVAGVALSLVCSAQSWKQVTPRNSPSARSGHVMAYDEVRQRTVLFGGGHPNTVYSLGDTWEWDGQNWTDVTPLSISPKLRGAAMCYDSARRRIVMFGGVLNNTWSASSQTWEWDGKRWYLMRSVISPTARGYGHQHAGRDQEGVPWHQSRQARGRVEGLGASPTTARRQGRRKGRS